MVVRPVDASTERPSKEPKRLRVQLVQLHREGRAGQVTGEGSLSYDQTHGVPQVEGADRSRGFITHGLPSVQIDGAERSIDL